MNRQEVVQSNSGKDDTKEIRGVRESIFNFKNMTKNIIVNKAMGRFSSSIVLDSYLYTGSGIFNYITTLYSSAVRDGNILLKYGLVKENKKIKRQLPYEDLEFITRDGFTLCKINIVKMENPVTGYTDKSIRITFIGRYAYKYMKDIITIYKKKHPKEKQGYRAVSLFNYTFNSTMRLELCSFDDVILKDKEKLIIKPLNDFLDSKDLYNQYKCTYKTGFLLHGKPGTGKSSTIKAIINHCIDAGYNDPIVKILDLSKKMIQFSEDIKSIYTGSTYLSEKELNIVIMEEIDSIFSKNDRKGSTTIITEDGEEIDSQEDNDNKMKLNLLLQFLDGSISPNNTIFIATTNFIENLDEALMRDGRFDNQINYEYFNKEEALELCKKFDCSEDVIKNVKYPVAPVTLQKLMFKAVKYKMK